MSRSYTPLPPSASMACSGTVLLLLPEYSNWLGVSMSVCEILTGSYSVVTVFVMGETLQGQTPNFKV
jgi:hypothetical protein